MWNTHEDILKEILVRVPARPLVRFKCVSKHWYSLISDPNFCHRHTLRNPHSSISAFFSKFSFEFRCIPVNDLDHCSSGTSSCIPVNDLDHCSSGTSNYNPLNFVDNPRGNHITQSCNGLFLSATLPSQGTRHSAWFSKLSGKFPFIPVIDFDHCPSGTSSNFNPLNFVDNPRGNHIVQSCNGLFLCAPLLPQGMRLNLAPADKRVCYVLNPTTNKFTTLTPPAAAAAAATGLPRVCGYALAFAPSRSPHYKVIFLWYADEPYPSGFYDYQRIEIYSSETRTWRLLDSTFDAQPVNYEDGVYCNGAVHWLGTHSEMTYYHIDEERVGLVDGIPDTDPRKGWQCMLTKNFWESQGRLHLIYVYRYSPTRLEVLEMGRDYSGWYVKYNVDLDPLCTACPNILYGIYDLLSFVPEEHEEHEESSSLLLHAPGKDQKSKVIFYNMRNNTFKCIDLIPKAGVGDSFRRNNGNIYRYVESLAVV